MSNMDSTPRWDHIENRLQHLERRLAAENNHVLMNPSTGSNTTGTTSTPAAPRPTLEMTPNRPRNMALPVTSLLRTVETETDKKLKKIMTQTGILTINGLRYKADKRDLMQLGDLGNGTCGNVVKMRHMPSGTIIAVKQMRRTGNTEENKRILMDLDVVLKSDCKYIVRCLGCFIHDPEVWICMELMSMCFDKLLKLSKKPVPEDILGKVTVATVKALSYLKDKHNVIHRDVKPSNILIDELGNIKLCDFGISGRLVDSKAHTRSAGCAAYMAPERIDPKKPEYDIRADVWSLGITLVELATARSPYEGCNFDFEVLTKVLECDPPSLPEGKGDGYTFSAEFRDFVNKCLTKNYQFRPKYPELMEQPFIKYYEKAEIDIPKWFKVFTEAADIKTHFRNYMPPATAIAAATANTAMTNKSIKNATIAAAATETTTMMMTTTTTTTTPILTINTRTTMDNAKLQNATTATTTATTIKQQYQTTQLPQSIASYYNNSNARERSNIGTIIGGTNGPHHQRQLSGGGCGGVVGDGRLKCLRSGDDYTIGSGVGGGGGGGSGSSSSATSTSPQSPPSISYAPAAHLLNRSTVHDVSAATTTTTPPTHDELAQEMQKLYRKSSSSPFASRKFYNGNGHAYKYGGGGSNAESPKKETSTSMLSSIGQSIIRNLTTSPFSQKKHALHTLHGNQIDPLWRMPSTDSYDAGITTLTTTTTTTTAAATIKTTLSSPIASTQTTTITNLMSSGGGGGGGAGVATAPPSKLRSLTNSPAPLRKRFTDNATANQQQQQSQTQQQQSQSQPQPSLIPINRNDSNPQRVQGNQSPIVLQRFYHQQNQLREKEYERQQQQQQLQQLQQQHLVTKHLPDYLTIIATTTTPATATTTTNAANANTNYLTYGHYEAAAQLQLQQTQMSHIPIAATAAAATTTTTPIPAATQLPHGHHQHHHHQYSSSQSTSSQSSTQSSASTCSQIGAYDYYPTSLSSLQTQAHGITKRLSTSPPPPPAPTSAPTTAPAPASLLPSVTLSPLASTRFGTNAGTMSATNLLQQQQHLQYQPLPQQYVPQHTTAATTTPNALRRQQSSSSASSASASPSSPPAQTITSLQSMHHNTNTNTEQQNESLGIGKFGKLYARRQLQTAAATAATSSSNNGNGVHGAYGVCGAARDEHIRTDHGWFHTFTGAMKRQFASYVKLQLNSSATATPTATAAAATTTAANAAGTQPTSSGSGNGGSSATTNREAQHKSMLAYYQRTLSGGGGGGGGGSNNTSSSTSPTEVPPPLHKSTAGDYVMDFGGNGSFLRRYAATGGSGGGGGGGVGAAAAGINLMDRRHRSPDPPPRYNRGQSPLLLRKNLLEMSGQSPASPLLNRRYVSASPPLPPPRRGSESVPGSPQHFRTRIHYTPEPQRRIYRTIDQ